MTIDNDETIQHMLILIKYALVLQAIIIQVRVITPPKDWPSMAKHVKAAVKRHRAKRQSAPASQAPAPPPPDHPLVRSMAPCDANPYAVVFHNLCFTILVFHNLVFHHSGISQFMPGILLFGTIWHRLAPFDSSGALG